MRLPVRAGIWRALPQHRNHFLNPAAGCSCSRLLERQHGSDGELGAAAVRLQCGPEVWCERHALPVPLAACAWLHLCRCSTPAVLQWAIGSTDTDKDRPLKRRIINSSPCWVILTVGPTHKRAHCPRPEAQRLLALTELLSPKNVDPNQIGLASMRTISCILSMIMAATQHEYS